ncbi:invasion associated locus B family protein [Rhodovulum tesquicola]|uniref:invasion associated locus B family protein n=1 Tax=Rhodovulum tesquicola TaxID=540254 RepID=UPI0020980798|nr:invasion associated locus B family protein [Rhodovulum tesquicola]MCO8144465.1 invasion associated locus B family protein [Rhodovulum tesquicola]
MRELLRPIGLVALMSLAGPVLAQDAGGTPEAGAEAAEPPVATTAEIERLPMGEDDADDAPRAYVKEVFQDWQVVCVRVNGDRESCNMQQLLRDSEDNPVSQVSMAPLPPAAAPRAAAVEIATPLETLLSEDLRLGIDAAAPKRYRFSFCTPQACYARFALTAEEVAAFKAGRAAKVTIVPLVAPDQTAEIAMSLSGFTAAYDLVAATLAGQ